MTSSSRAPLTRAHSLTHSLTHTTPAFLPRSRAKLQSAVGACLKLSPKGDCSNAPRGAISGWDVSKVTDMSDMFSYATFFRGDISKWDVSNINDMDAMFFQAVAFKQNLCGDAWAHSKASKVSMFTGSSGSISRTACMSKPTLVTTQVTHQYVSRRPITERELKARAPITMTVSTSTLVIAPTIAHKIQCPKCGKFKKSGRVSCCAPGGDWFKNCAGVGNKHVAHSWSEGVKACKCKSKANACRYILPQTSDRFHVFIVVF